MKTNIESVDLQITDQQNQAIKSVMNWYKTLEKPFFYLAGFAGSGKTTLAKIIAENINGKVLFAAYTGKAAIVMQGKGCLNASTIHSLIYKPVEDKNGMVTFHLNYDSLLSDASLIIIDECSMVGSDLAKDLLSFDVPILVLGDPAQLPPVSSEGYFTSDDPDFMLTEIHRQALENPIIAMSMKVRNFNNLDFGNYGESKVISQSAFDFNEILDADQLICGLNKTRTLANDKIRRIKKLDPEKPVIGDKLICLKNKREKGLFNGGLWAVEEIKKRYPQATSMVVKPLDEGVTRNPAQIYVHDAYFQGTESNLDWKFAKQFNPFTYGYAMTVHKSQGSQWKNLIVFDESDSFRDDKWRHLYTAITRASEKITIVL